MYARVMYNVVCTCCVLEGSFEYGSVSSPAMSSFDLDCVCVCVANRWFSNGMALFYSGGSDVFDLYSDMDE